MNIELDQYFTPSGIAEKFIESTFENCPSVCIDTSCGSGNLLRAASNVFGNITCVGLDKDKNVIERSRRKYPDWMLSVADILNPLSYKKTTVVSNYTNCGLLLLNPPFSNARRKSVYTEYQGDRVRSSVAMAHILTSLQLFSPKHGAIIFAPESVIYSEIDSKARRVISKRYNADIIEELDNSTFRGARVRCTVIKLSDQKESISSQETITQEQFPKLDVIRGGLPVHVATFSDEGIPYIHSTELKKLVNSKSLSLLPKTSSNLKGKVSGWMVLIPRVGVPNISNIKPFYCKSKCHLSDCVIALVVDSKVSAELVAKSIKNNWQSFLDNYRGTGARYITINRLVRWISIVLCDTERESLKCIDLDQIVQSVSDR